MTHQLRQSIHALFAVLLLAVALPSVASAQDPAEPEVIENEDGTVTVRPREPAGQEGKSARDPSEAQSVEIDFGVETSIYDLIKFFAPIKKINFVISDVKELQGKKVTIIGYKKVRPEAAWQAFLSALEASGYSLSIVGDTAKVVKSSEAGQKPISIGTGQPRASDAYVTQLIQLENVSVADMSKIIQTMAPSDAKIVSYPPTNTMIITDTANNIRKLYKLMKELDVAAPRSTMEIYKLQFATASELKAIIEELYGTAEDESSATAADTRRTSRSSRRTSSRTSSRSSRTTPTDSEAVTAGETSKYISKVLVDERTNYLLVLANPEGHSAVRDIIAKVDIDVDPQNRAQIRVVYLENAEAEEVSQVLQQLSQEGNAQASRGRLNNRAAPTTGTASRAATRGGAAAEAADGEESSAIAAFDSGMRIAADENTNSLVIIANREDFAVVKKVIDQLDMERRQVFVDAVILELSSEDSSSLGLAAHVPQSPAEGAVGFVGAQLGANSLGLSQDALSGLAVGVFGETVDVPITDPLTGLPTTFAIPAFGLALNALKTSGSTNIISNPSLTMLDNEEAQIIVGRKIPFPTQNALNNLGQPVISFQREDVAITMKVTPRINSSDYVTLELELEVQEVEESAQSAAVSAAGGGFITSQRQLTTVTLVRDNQTVVLGGLVGSTEGSTENKVPVLGDIPLIGALFRATTSNKRRTNLMIFLTPHIIDDVDDMLEVQRVKEAQRQEYLRRFYGKSRDEFYAELKSLLQYSMNYVDQPSMFRGPTTVSQDLRIDGEPLSDETRAAFEDVLGDGRSSTEPGMGAGELPEGDPVIIIDDGGSESVPGDLQDLPEGE